MSKTFVSLLNNCNEAVVLKQIIMYKEAFELISNLIVKGNSIKKVTFLKKGFRVYWTNDTTIFFNYDENSIIEFLEIYEAEELN